MIYFSLMLRKISKPEWGEKLIDLVGPIPDGGIVHLFEEAASTVHAIILCIKIYSFTL